MASGIVRLSTSIFSHSRRLTNIFTRSCSNEAHPKGPIIGIDLGTTNSCVAVMEGDEPRVIANAEGARTTPSVVAFTEEGQVIVGESARRQAIGNSQNTVYGTKRLIGRRFKDPQVQSEIKHLPFSLMESTNGDCWIRVRGKEYSPSQIGGFVLSKMKETASSYLGAPISDAVITVPAYFNDSQRQATKDAGVIAGLNVFRIINEPTAAALAYGLKKKDINKIVAIYDLGGGTFDISILEINDGVFEVKSTNGDTRLGGEDFDNVLIKHFIKIINSELKEDVTKDLKALQRIKEAVEKAKIELSFVPETEINLPYLYEAKSFSKKFKRAELENLVDPLIQRTVAPCKAALSDAGLGVEKIDEVILVGGMSRMPKVQALVKNLFKREPSKGVNPDEAVAVGAAIQGGVLQGSVSDIVLVDVTPYSLGIKTLGDIFSAVVSKNTPIPTRKTQTFTTSEDNQTTVSVCVYQGERALCADNLLLGEFLLGPIPPRPRSQSRIEVAFELDSNGIVKVSAVDVQSNKKANATLKSNPRGLSKSELEKMAKEAEKYAEKDLSLKAVVEEKNKGVELVYRCKEFTREHASSIPASELADFNTLVTNFESTMNRADVTEAELRTKSNEISIKLSAFHQLIDSQKSQNEDSTENATTEDSTTTQGNTTDSDEKK